MMSRNRSRYISSLFPNSCLVTFRKRSRYIFFFSNSVPHNFPKKFMTAFFSLFLSLRLTMSQNRSRQISSTSLFRSDHLSISSPSLRVRDVQRASLNNPITETAVHFFIHLIKIVLNTLRTGSFKLFKRPFPGFLTILTL